MTKWLAFWCREGFEYLDDITQYEKWDQQQLVNILTDQPRQTCPLDQLIWNLKLRARFNSDREYELYAFQSQPDVTRESVQQWADSDPQSLVDWIRSNGIKIYSDYHKTRVRKIV